MSRLTKSRHPAYHLRPNKAVDRLLFLDVIRAFELYSPLDRHTYVGFAGPFLEDFRLFGQAFPALKMISVEEDEETYKRQLFHKCSRHIDLRLCTFRDFLATNYPAGPTITWADYTDMNRECLLEVSDIARKAVPLSVLRVTVRAETPVYRKLSLHRRPRQLPKGKKQAFASFREEYLKSIQIEDVAYDGSLFSWEGFGERGYPSLLTEILKAVISSACSRPKVFMPLHAVVYSDGTIMLSVTGIFCKSGDSDKIREHFIQEDVLPPEGPVLVQDVDVPVLTTKERLHLESILPSRDESGDSCRKRLGYLIEGDGSEENSEHKMRQYERYFRFYPYFGKLVP